MDTIQKSTTDIATQLGSLFSYKLPTANDDVDFDIKLSKYSKDRDSKPVVIVFCDESSEQCGTLFEFVNQWGKPWTNYVTFFKVDKNKCPRIATSYNIESVPTIVIKEGKSGGPQTITTDYQEKLKEYIVRKHGTYLESVSMFWRMYVFG